MSEGLKQARKSLGMTTTSTNGRETRRASRRQQYAHHKAVAADRLRSFSETTSDTTRFAVEDLSTTLRPPLARIGGGLCFLLKLAVVLALIVTGAGVVLNLLADLMQWAMHNGYF